MPTIAPQWEQSSGQRFDHTAMAHVGRRNDGNGAQIDGTAVCDYTAMRLKMRP